MRTVWYFLANAKSFNSTLTCIRCSGSTPSHPAHCLAKINSTVYLPTWEENILHRPTWSFYLLLLKSGEMSCHLLNYSIWFQVSHCFTSFKLSALRVTDYTDFSNLVCAVSFCCHIASYPLFVMHTLYKMNLCHSVIYFGDSQQTEHTTESCSAKVWRA